MLTTCLKLFASSVFVISCLSLHVHDKTLLLCICVEQHNKKHNFPCTVKTPVSFSVRLFVLGLHRYVSLSACLSLPVWCRSQLLCHRSEMFLLFQANGERPCAEWLTVCGWMFCSWVFQKDTEQSELAVLQDCLQWSHAPTERQISAKLPYFLFSPKGIRGWWMKYRTVQAKGQRTKAPVRRSNISCWKVIWRTKKQNDENSWQKNPDITWMALCKVYTFTKV